MVVYKEIRSARQSLSTTQHHLPLFTAIADIRWPSFVRVAIVEAQTGIRCLAQAIRIERQAGPAAALVATVLMQALSAEIKSIQRPVVIEL